MVVLDGDERGTRRFVADGLTRETRADERVSNILNEAHHMLRLAPRVP
jgi:hypothetical protein